ncbi:hypothetical protein MTO96_015452 [Rhipicephalus appendiculatus]
MNSGRKRDQVSRAPGRDSSKEGTRRNPVDAHRPLLLSACTLYSLFISRYGRATREDETNSGAPGSHTWRVFAAFPPSHSAILPGRLRVRFNPAALPDFFWADFGFH